MLKRIKNLLHIKQTEKVMSVCEQINNLYDSLNEDIILVKIGEDLVQYGDFICGIISELRSEIKDECGFILPPVRTRDYPCLQENEFVITVQGEDVFNGFVLPTEDGIREELYDGLKTVVYDKLDEIFTNEITEKYINTVQKNNSLLIWNLTSILSVIDIKTILSDIIQKGKSINNIDYIFEKIGEHILSDGEQNAFFKRHNPHTIAKKIAEKLQ